MLILVIVFLYSLALSTPNLIFTRDQQELVISQTIGQTKGELEYAINIDIDAEHTVVVHTKVDTDLTKLSRHPVEFMVKQNGLLKHWQVPNHEFKSSNFASTTLCPSVDDKTSMNISVIVSTSGLVEVPFTVVLQRSRYVVTAGETLEELAVSPTSMKVFRLELPDNMRYLVKLKNMSSAVCSTLTVRPADACPYTPLPDKESQVIFGSNVQHQVMLEKAAIHISRDLFPATTSAVNIFIVAKTSDADCYLDTDVYSDSVLGREVKVMLSVEPDLNDLNGSVASVLGLYLGGGFIVVLLHWLCNKENR